MSDLILENGHLRRAMPNPTEADLKDPLFEAVWQAIKAWDVNVPGYYEGYTGASGSHVMLILDEIRKLAREPR